MARHTTAHHIGTGMHNDIGTGMHNDAVLQHAASEIVATGPGTGMQYPPPLGESLVSLAEEGHLVLVLPPGEVITGSMASGAAEKIDRLASVHSLPLLLTLTGVDSISRSARDVFSAARSLAAVAVVGVTPVDRVIANFLLGGEVQPCPTRYFSLESDALEWLKRYAA